ncbi:hypothetical protein HaLaN_02065, partial [Haematococcus lacustris]
MACIKLLVAVRNESVVATARGAGARQQVHHLHIAMLQHLPGALAAALATSLEAAAAALGALPMTALCSAGSQPLSPPLGPPLAGNNMAQGCVGLGIVEDDVFGSANDGDAEAIQSASSTRHSTSPDSGCSR